MERRRTGPTAPHPLAAKQPNAFGLHDMLGNVWQWCWDYADPARYADYRSPPGGGWADDTMVLPCKQNASTGYGIRQPPRPDPYPTLA